MQDHLDLTMFLDPGRRILSVGGSGSLAIVSPFEPAKTEKDNVRALRDVYEAAPKHVAPDLIYGKDFGVIVFRSANGQTRKYCQQVARTYNQLGCIYHGTLLRTDGSEQCLPAWDGTTQCLEEWIRYLRPGFAIQGIWNLSWLYCFMRYQQYRFGLIESQLPDGTVVLRRRK